MTSKDAEENARELEKLDQEWEELGDIKLATRFDMLGIVVLVLLAAGFVLVGLGLWVHDNDMYLAKKIGRRISYRSIAKVGWGVTLLGLSGVVGSLALKFCYVGPESDALVERAKSYHFRRQELLEEIATSVRSENSRNEEHKPPD